MADLVRSATVLDTGDLDRLQRLVAEWQMFADLSFADLLLWVPFGPQDAGWEGFRAIAQMRPTTGTTCYLHDHVGAVVPWERRSRLRTAWEQTRIVREGEPEWRDGTPVRVEAIPVPWGGRTIAVVTRETNLAAARTPSPLEVSYLGCAADLAQMVSEGRFPFAGPPSEHAAAEPRVGDGLIRLDRNGQVEFASPNAVSAYRRLGVAGELVGLDLAEVSVRLLPDGSSAGSRVAGVASGRVAKSGEVEANGSVVQLRALPLVRRGERIGALVLVHDVTELRRRELALVGKDATIREIHHRVKNNLQTVAALLRLQARRLDVPAARAALEESERRVASIALVHETLSQTLDETVAFDDVADGVIRMVSDLAGEVRVRLQRTGSFGVLPGAVATSLAMVLTELLQNALEHGVTAEGGSIEVAVERRPTGLDLRIRDRGRGLPAGFVLGDSPRLGLQIVRTLVTAELGGAIDLRPGPGGGAEAVVSIPVGRLGDPPDLERSARP